jgi:sugar lactone lactonase YvrE
MPRLRRSTPLLLLPILLITSPSAAVASGDPSPPVYTLRGDAGGSTFEGIGIDPRGTFYVSERTGGEIHRGQVGRRGTQVWLDEREALRAGRTTAVGVAADRAGRVYVAGGDNRAADEDPSTGPDFWIYGKDRQLLAAVRVPSDGPVFLNDVAIGPDGAAYVTNSLAPQIFRIRYEDGRWRAELWSDAGAPGGPIEQPDGFGLNGIETAPNGKSLVVAQSDPGALWRFDLRTRAATRIATGAADLSSSDGLVVRGTTLVAVRNFPQRLAVLRLDPDARSARLLQQVTTSSKRVFTTGAEMDGQLLLVDSQFEESPPSRNSEVVARRFPS